VRRGTYASWPATATAFYFSMWTATGGSGSDLSGNTFTSLGGLSGAGTGWLQVDGSTASVGWIGNTTYVFNDTAWVGGWIHAGKDIGVDTDGTSGHGFYLDNYTGSNYVEMGWNAMVRARFNGDAVPVELAGFTVE